MTLLARNAKRVVIAGFVVALGAVIGLLGVARDATTAHAVPIPSPVYAITAISGTHTASLLNLPVGQPGVPDAPIPVDINGDLLPDITVGVNLVNVSGVFSNPPNLGKIIAPNIQINRIPTANLLGQPSLPLKVYITLTLFDSSGGPPTLITFGYDTAQGGSIPEAFTAMLGGLNTFFNPMEAVIDTTGLSPGVNLGINRYGLANVVAPYQGPLTILAGVNVKGRQDAAISLSYRPLPSSIDVTYGTDSKGQHISYAHDVLTQVDTTTNVVLTQTTSAGPAVTNLSARIDRMPRSIKLDVGGISGGAGNIKYTARSDGRPPDVGVLLSNTQPKQPPLNARIDIEGLPATMYGEWRIAPNGLPGHALFNASGQGIGALEAYINNYAGTPVKLTPFAPNEQQFFNFQQIPGGTAGPEQLISARIERLRSASFDQTSDGYTGNLQLGDGELPLQAHIGIDNRTASPPSPQIEAQSTISPLPANISFAFHQPGTDQATNPLKIDYTASSSIDVNADVVLRLPGTGLTDPCGATNTICGNLAIRNIPASIEARIVSCGVSGSPGATTCPELLPRPTTPESRFEIDDVPQNGGTTPDITADATIGPGIFDVPGANQTPLVAHFGMQTVPAHIRVREVQGANKTLQRAEFHACDYDYVASVCRLDSLGHSTETPIGQINFNVHDWITRPMGLAAPADNAPMYTSISALGNGSSQVLFEAAGQVTKIAELQYLNLGSLFGVKARIGKDQDFLVDALLKNVVIPNPLVSGTPTVTLHASNVISPLPSSISLCFRPSGQPVSPISSDPITAPCEVNNPFGDGLVPSSPIAFAYTANTPFDLTAKLDGTVDNGIPAQLLTLAASAKVQHLPSNWAFYVMPSVGAVTPASPYANVMRILTTTTTPHPAGLNITASASKTTGGASCDDPHPTGNNVLCAALSITNLTPNLSALIDSTTGAARYDFHTCNWQFFAPTPGCTSAGGPEAPITNITVSGRAFNGNPRTTPILDPTRSPTQYVTVVADQEPNNNYDFRGGASFNQIFHATYDQSPDGFDANLKLGDGVKPLELDGYLDTRTGSLPDKKGLHVEASALISPLPAVISVSQHGDVHSATTPMTFTYAPSSTVSVQGHGVVYLPTAYAGGHNPACGDTDTACANMSLNNIPSQVVATLSSVDGAVQQAVGSTPAQLQRQLLFNLTSSSSSAPKPDLYLDAVAGVPSDTKMIGHNPLYAHAEVIGFPKVVTARMVQLVSNPNTTAETQSLQRLEVHTCNYNFSTQSCAGPEDQLDRLTIQARDFKVRPAGFPSPTAGIHDNDYASVVLRPDPTDNMAELFEADVNLVAFKELQYINDDAAGVKGFKIRIGDGKGFTARADIGGFLLGNTTFGGMNLAKAVVDAVAETHVSNLPDSIALCLNQGGGAVPATAPTPDADFTAHCQNPEPFASQTPAAPAPDHLPISVAYTASAPISDITADVTVTLHADLAFVFGTFVYDTGLPIDARHAHAHVDITNIPQSFVAHILTPSQDATTGKTTGPFRLLYTSVNPQGQLGVAFDGELTQDLPGQPGTDSICRDPRPNATSFCGSGKLDNLPLTVSGYFNPDQTTNNNLQVHTSGEKLLSLENLELDSVKPDATSPTGSDVIIATASITDLPRDIVGAIVLPATSDPPSIDVSAGPGQTIGKIVATFQNFVAPNPFVSGVPVRTDFPGPYDDSFVVRKAGPSIFASAMINKLQAVAFEPARDGGGVPLDTKLMKLDFGQNDNSLRAYADLDLTNSGNAALSGHVVADVVITHVSGQLDLCFRGQKQIPGSPATPDFCDSAPAPNEGAFQFNDHQGAQSQLSVHAFVRAAKSTGGVLAGKLDVDNIPSVVEGLFGGGVVDAGGFDGVDANGIGTTPDGIGKIAFDLANGDLADTPYNQPFPWGSSVSNNLQPLPPPDGNQFASLAAHNADFHVMGSIGEPGGGGSPGTDLDRVQVSPQACTAPAPPDVPSSRGATYPFFPQHDGTTYTCVTVRFKNVNGPPVPLYLYANVIEAGQQIILNHAGLSTIPTFIQLDLAKADTVQPDKQPPTLPNGQPNPHAGEANLTAGELRPPCGTLTGATAQNPNNDCMAPMIRFDTPGGSALFGVVSLGSEGHVSQLGAVQPRDSSAVPNLNAAPGFDGSGWTSDWPATAGSGVSGPTGIRVKVGKFPEIDDGSTPPNVLAPAATVVQAGIRLPIPASLTIDQFQSWSAASCQDTGQATCSQSDPYGVNIPITSAQNNYFDGSDLRFHYIVRDNNGATVNSLGLIAAMIQDFGSGDQILVGDPNSDTTVNANGKTTVHAGTLNIPGEVGLSIYSRNYSGQGQKLYQIDGRISSPLSIRAEIFGGAESALGKLDAQVLNIPAVPRSGDPDFALYQQAGNENLPTFRLRAEMLADSPGGPPSPSTGGTTGQGDGSADSGKNNDCSFLECAIVDIKIAEVHAFFDFAPEANAARRIDAVIHTAGIKNGLEASGFTEVNPNPGHDVPARFTADAGVDINPIFVFFHIGIPILGSLDFILDMQASAEIDINDTPNFWLQQNVIHLEAASGNAGALSQLDINGFIFQLHGLAESLLGLFFGDPILLGVERPPGPLLIPFLPCAPGSGGLNDLFIGGISDPQNVIIDPLGVQSGLIFYGLLGPVFDGLNVLAGDILAPFACFLSAGHNDLQLINESGVGTQYPSDPIGFPTHPIPPAAAGTPASGPPAVTPPVTKNPLVVPSTDTPSPYTICGRHDYSSVEIKPGAVVNIGGYTDTHGTHNIAGLSSDNPLPDCPTDAPASITSDSTMKLDGTVNAPSGAGSGGEVKFIAQSIEVSGAINGQAGKITLISGSDLAVTGGIHADNVQGAKSINYYPNGANTTSSSGSAGGNSGAGHGGAGQNGSSPSGGPNYGNTSFAVLNGGSLPPPLNQTVGQESGLAGSTLGGGVPAGNGGGQIALEASTVEISGSVTANGGPGGSPAGDPGHCFIAAVPPSGSNPGTPAQPNNGTAGAGGGSGGSIYVSAVRVSQSGTVQAIGGNAGDGKGGQGGAGAGGIIKVNASLLPSWSPAAHDGNVSARECSDPSDPPAAGGLSSPQGQVPQQVLPGSQAAMPTTALVPVPPGTPPQAGQPPTPVFWNQSTPTIPYTAAGQNSTTSGELDVWLCGIRRPAEAALGIDQTAPTPNLPYGFGTPTGQSAVNPCGSSVSGGSGVSVQDGPHVLGHKYYATTSGVISDSITASTMQHGYWFLYTVAEQPANPGEDCADVLVAFLHGSDCSLEALPIRPDAVIGVDNEVPNLDQPTVNGANDFHSNSSTVALSIPQPQDTMTADQSGLHIYSGGTDTGKVSPAQIPTTSGVLGVRCSNDNGVTWLSCAVGTQQWLLPPGDGNFKITVEAIDNAGNASNPPQAATVEVHVEPPTSDGHLVPSSPTGTNGWYKTNPTFSIDNFQSPGVTHEKPGDPQFDYQFVDDSVFTDGVTHSGSKTVTSAGAVFTLSDVGETITTPGGQLPAGTTITAVGQTFNDGSVTSGSKTLTSAAAAFTSADVGETLATPNGEFPANTTIVSVTDGHTLDVSAASTVTSTGVTINVVRPTIATVSNAASASASGVTLQLGRDGSIETCGKSSSDTVQVVAGTCTITQNLPSDGMHAFKWRARDAVNNVSAWQEIDYKLDVQKPISAVSTIPVKPQYQGATKFFTTQPLVVISAVDPAGGSGLPVNDITYSFSPDRSGLGHTYTGPIPLTDGFNREVCWIATDIAGNADGPICSGDAPDSQGAGGEGADGIWNVDTTPPDATATVSPASPDGSAGWYRTIPVVTLSGYSDAVSGPPSDATTELSYRVDNSPTTTCISPCTVDPQLLGTGAHTVFWSAVDRVGNVRPEAAIPLNVDIEAPQTQVDVFAPTPQGSNGWYTSEPWVALTGMDQPPLLNSDNQPPLVVKGVVRTPRDFDHLLPYGSGVQSITVQIDAETPFTYTGPFPVPAGSHNVCWSGVDVAGNAELVLLPGSGERPHFGPVCKVINVDLANPTAPIVNNPATPQGGGGWYTSPVSVSVNPGDPTPGSGLTSPAGPYGGPLCADTAPGDPTQAGTCISIDGTPFVPYTGPVTITEGLHSVQTFSVDVSGRHSDIDTALYQVDLSTPQVDMRTVPGAPAQNGWWRTLPLTVLRSVDGDQNSGPSSITYRIDSGAWTPYVQPFTVPEGNHTVSFQGTDVAGNTSAVQTLGVPVDVTPPVVIATSPTPTLWLQLLSALGDILGLSPANAQLGWTVSDNLSPHVHGWIIIYNLLGQAVRYLDAGTVNTSPGVTYTESTSWDGKDETLTGLVPAGLYYYRVVTTDDAGNFSQSGQSIPIEIRATLNLSVNPVLTPVINLVP